MDRARSSFLALVALLPLVACGPDQPGEAAQLGSAAAEGKAPPRAACRRWQTCVPQNPCHTGWVTGCQAGQPVCTDIGGWLSNGTTCGDDQVCYMGECTPCAAGDACQPEEPPGTPLTCRAGAIACGTGQPVCVETGPASDGSACWPGSEPYYVCVGGGCTYCPFGEACPPSGAPCHRGVWTCQAGPVCADTGEVAPDGTWCGPDQVCSAGECVACASGQPCEPAGMPCMNGYTDCSTGAPLCQPWYAKPEGTPCGDGLVCDWYGQCVAPCVGGESCTPPNPCRTGTKVCYGPTSWYCQEGPPVEDGTSCGPDQVCFSGSCTTCGAGSFCPSTDPCRAPGRVSCATGRCEPGDPLPEGTGCGVGLETCSEGTCTGVPGTAIVVRALPGPSTDLTGTTWTLCDAGAPLPGQSQRRSETYGIGTVTYVEDTFLSSTSCAGEPEPSQHRELVAQMVTFGDRVVGWQDGPPPAGLPPQVIATAAEFSGTWPDTGEPFTIRTLRFVDGQAYPRRIYEGKEPLGPDGFPTTLTGAKVEVVTPAFTQADLAGPWRYTILWAGPTVETGAVGWARGTVSVNEGGVATVETYADSAGSTTVPPIPPITYLIDGAGVVTATTTLFSGMWGKMNQSKTLWVATSTQGARMRLALYQRVVPDAVFGASDLASSTFTFRQLATGAAPAWERGDAVVGADLAYALEGLVDSSDPSGPPDSVPNAGTFSIGAEGVVATNQEPSFAAFMSADRQTMIGTQGSRQPVGTNTYRLTALVRSGATFAQGDMAGTWHYVNLATTIGAAAWAHGTVTFDGAGLGVFGPQLDSSGATQTPPPVTLYVAGDGTVTQPAPSVLSGILDPAKEIMVATETHEPGVYGLIIAIR